MERSEIQHVVNQLLTRAAYSRDIGGGGGGGGSPDRGFGGRAITSPRVGLAESSPSKAATQAAPHLPSQLAHHHRKCLKKECTCADRLAATLGANDPRLALDRLFDRQLRLLMSVRNLWQHAEAARGELPHIPQMPAVPRGGGSPELRLPRALQRGAPNEGDQGGYGDEAGAPVGAYMDGGVIGGGGLDEGGSLGPHRGGRSGLPERLEDL